MMSADVTREEALREADETLERMLQSGDEKVFGEARRPDGTIDIPRLVAAAIRARERLADWIMANKPVK